MISTLIALPYELARMPLVIVDKNVSDRLPETSGTRVGLDRAIGAVDKIAGALLGNRDIAQRGVDRIDRSERLVAAAVLEREAGERREQARKTAVVGRREAAAKRGSAQRRAVTGLDEAAAAEKQGKKQAATRASRTATAKKTAADQRAINRTADLQQRKERRVSAAETKKKAAQREAKADLVDARRTEQSAVAARRDADRLSDLAKAKKQARTQG